MSFILDLFSIQIEKLYQTQSFDSLVPAPKTFLQATKVLSNIFAVAIDALFAAATAPYKLAIDIIKNIFPHLDVLSPSSTILVHLDYMPSDYNNCNTTSESILQLGLVPKSRVYSPCFESTQSKSLKFVVSSYKLF